MSESFSFLLISFEFKVTVRVLTVYSHFLVMITPIQTHTILCSVYENILVIKVYICDENFLTDVHANMYLFIYMIMCVTTIFSRVYIQNVTFTRLYM